MDEDLDGVRVLAISKEMVDLLGMSYLKNNGVYGLLGSESAAVELLFITTREWIHILLHYKSVSYYIHVQFA